MYVGACMVCVLISHRNVWYEWCSVVRYMQKGLNNDFSTSWLVNEHPRTKDNNDLWDLRVSVGDIRYEHMIPYVCILCGLLYGMVCIKGLRVNSG